MSVTPYKERSGKRIAEILYLSTKNVPTKIKMPNMVNKPHYEGSEATETSHIHF